MTQTEAELIEELININRKQHPGRERENKSTLLKKLQQAYSVGSNTASSAEDLYKALKIVQELSPLYYKSLAKNRQIPGETLGDYTGFLEKVAKHPNATEGILREFLVLSRNWNKSNLISLINIHRNATVRATVRHPNATEGILRKVLVLSRDIYGEDNKSYVLGLIARNPNATEDILEGVLVLCKGLKSDVNESYVLRCIARNPNAKLSVLKGVVLCTGMGSDMAQSVLKLVDEASRRLPEEDRKHIMSCVYGPRSIAPAESTYEQMHYYNPTHRWTAAISRPQEESKGPSRKR